MFKKQSMHLIQSVKLKSILNDIAGSQGKKILSDVLEYQKKINSISNYWKII